MSYNYNPYGSPFGGAPGQNQQNPYQQAQYHQYPYQQPPYQQPPYQQPPYQQPPYQQPPYQQPPYQQPPYQQPFHQSSSPYEPPPPYAPSTTKGNAGNLIKNPNFEAKCWNQNGETKEFKTGPWEILETGGDGWQLEKKPSGSAMGQCPMEAGPYAHCVVGSHGWCKRVQYIDLKESGFSAHVMDQEKPCIHVYEWFCARSDCNSEYYMNISLLDSDRNPIDHFISGTKSAGSQDWQKVEHKFLNYPTGVRFIRYEDGTKDSAGWAGHFGAKMCEPTVKIVFGPPPQCPPMVNLLANPSFRAKRWNGNDSKDIDFQPWEIEKNESGFCLERTPAGTSSKGYPQEFAAFDVWCVSTSNELSQRSQIVNLVENGYSAHFLDQHRPRIKVCEWFRSRQDCGGRYFMQVALLDQHMSRIPGVSFDTSLKDAPVDHWEKEEHVFTQIPPGVRYVEFRDGGQDQKFWAGNYGVKMIGAFVGVIPNESAPPPRPHYDPRPAPPTQRRENPRPAPPTQRRERTAPVLQPTYGAPTRPSPYGNLIDNMNLRPKYGWNGETCDEIEFSPWVVIEQGGDGLRLERSPQGSRTGGYPRKIGPAQHCIATSFGWFRREQTIDLVKKGFSPCMIARGRLQIYICEWFTSRGDCEGEYQLQVSLLDENHAEIPGCSFDSGICIAPADEWEQVDSFFYVVPGNARFVKFQDGGKDVKYWSGTFGVKMVGATVIAGEDLKGNVGNCVVM